MQKACSSLLDNLTIQLYCLLYSSLYFCIFLNIYFHFYHSNLPCLQSCNVSRIARLEVIAAYCSHFEHCVFEPPFGGLGTTYNVHLGLIGKCIVNFPLVLTELFSLVVTAEALGAKIDGKSVISLQRSQFDPKFQVEGVGLHQLFLHG